jgi:hypothetical protein
MLKEQVFVYSRGGVSDIGSAGFSRRYAVGKCAGIPSAFAGRSQQPSPEDEKNRFNLNDLP